MYFNIYWCAMCDDGGIYFICVSITEERGGCLPACLVVCEIPRQALGITFTPQLQCSAKACTCATRLCNIPCGYTLCYYDDWQQCFTSSCYTVYSLLAKLCCTLSSLLGININREMYHYNNSDHLV